MTPPLNYLPNPDFEADYLKSDEALALVLDVAETAAPLAASLAPKDQEYLADSIKPEAGFVDDVATGRVNAHDFKAAWKEFGTRREAAQPYLRPAMEATTGTPVKGGDK